MDGGRTTTSAPSSDTNYSLPGVLATGVDSNLSTTVTYLSVVMAGDQRVRTKWSKGHDGL